MKIHQQAIFIKLIIDSLHDLDLPDKELNELIKEFYDQKWETFGKHLGAIMNDYALETELELEQLNREIVTESPELKRCLEKGKY